MKKNTYQRNLSLDSLNIAQDSSLLEGILPEEWNTCLHWRKVCECEMCRTADTNEQLMTEEMLL